MTKRTLQAVLVEWTDASASGEWMTYESAMKQKLCGVTTLGFLLSSGKKGEDVKLVASVGDDEVMGVVDIPGKWVQSITRLGITVTVKKDEDDA